MSKKESDLSLSVLRSMLHYNPETGVFTWLTSDGGVNVGSVAGNINSNGYWVVGINGTKYRQHRLAWFYHYGCWPVGTVDHLDCNRSNNRIANLRDVTQAVNMQNRRNASVRSASGILGVYWSERHKGFMASLHINRKQKRRGPYKTSERAARAYVEMKRIYHEGCTL
jgi:HNH endonuclease